MNLRWWKKTKISNSVDSIMHKYLESPIILSKDQYMVKQLSSICVFCFLLLSCLLQALYMHNLWFNKYIILWYVRILYLCMVLLFLLL